MAGPETLTAAALVVIAAAVGFVLWRFRCAAEAHEADRAEMAGEAE